ncbi:hypothetical protein [Reyranella sp.]|nr:hypothetical protein [Reyranella sp.]
MVMPHDPPPPVPQDAVQRGMKHWTMIGVGAVILILVFLVSR